jgi:iron complex transport system permease protein
MPEETSLNKKSFSFIISLVVLLIISLFIFLGVLAIGPLSISFPDLVAFIFNPSSIEGTTQFNILRYYRLPRTTAAFFVGAALATSGLVYQNIFNNKLVSPDILGVSSGACVGAATGILFNLDNALIILLAFFSGLAAVILSLLLPKLMKNPSTMALVILGVVVSALMTSILGLIKYLADENNKLSEITFWIMGSMARVDWNQLAISLPLIGVLLILLIPLSWRVNVVSLGRDEARSLGVNYAFYRLLFIAISTLLTASCVSICGSIGWVGLIVPHIARAIAGNDSRKSLPFSALIGGTFMVVVESISRNITKTEIPISIITGILGTLFFLIIMARTGRKIHD